MSLLQFTFTFNEANDMQRVCVCGKGLPLLSLFFWFIQTSMCSSSAANGVLETRVRRRSSRLRHSGSAAALICSVFAFELDSCAVHGNHHHHSYRCEYHCHRLGYMVMVTHVDGLTCVCVGVENAHVQKQFLLTDKPTVARTNGNEMLVSFGMSCC